jgi:hypothetical protein
MVVVGAGEGRVVCCVWCSGGSVIVESEGLCFGDDGGLTEVGVGGMRWIVRRFVLPNPP